MKQDIRKLFENDVVNKKLLSNHREEFYKKLQKSSVEKPKKTFFLMKIAASLTILFLIGAYFMQKPQQKESSLLIEIQTIEKEYLKTIDQEWENFLKLTDDKKLIKRHEEKLSMLDKEYQELSVIFRKQPNDITVLEKLIVNLQRRLQALKEIQEHIKSLHQKNKSYETIVI